MRRGDHLWLGGLALVAGAAVILVVAWFAYQRALPATGPLAMRPSPGRNVEQLRTLNEHAAPWTALSAAPLLVAGLWLLVRQPSDKVARRVATAGAVAFLLVGMLAPIHGCAGLGPSC